MADEREIQRTLTDLRPNTRYIVRARTVNGFGIASEWSEALDFTTGTDESIPKPPTDLFAEFNNSDLLIRWTAPIANTDWTPLIDFSHYEITLIPSPAADPVSFIHETSEIAYVLSYQLNTAVWVTAQNVFAIEVRAVDTAGNESEPVSTTATATGTITETGITAEELEDFGVLFESYFDAGTVLYAAVDNTPVATTLAALKTLMALDAEDIQDIIGAMVTGNTETGIAVTYEDGDGTLDFVVTESQNIWATITSDSGSTTANTTTDTLTVTGSGGLSTSISGDTLTIGFATDMATQAELDAHINDTTDAHDASAISYAGSASPTYSGTDVEAIIDEIIAEKVDITAMAGYLSSYLPLAGGTMSGSIGMAGYSVSSVGSISFNNASANTIITYSGGTTIVVGSPGIASAVIQHADGVGAYDSATKGQLDAHINDTVDAHDASAISYAGSASPTYSGTDVEAIIDEIIAEKLDITLFYSTIGAYLPLAGGTMAGDINMDENDINYLTQLTIASPGGAGNIALSGLYGVADNVDDFATLVFLSGVGNGLGLEWFNGIDLTSTAFFGELNPGDGNLTLTAASLALTNTAYTFDAPDPTVRTSLYTQNEWMKNSWAQRNKEALRAWNVALSKVEYGTGTATAYLLGDSVTDWFNIGYADIFGRKVSSRFDERAYTEGFKVVVKQLSAWDVSYSGTANLDCGFGNYGRELVETATPDTVSHETYTTGFDLYYTKQETGGCDLLVYIDGVLETTINTTDAGVSGTESGFLWESDALTWGLHEIEVAASGAGSGIVDGVYVHTVDRDSGIKVFNGGHSGFNATSYDTYPGTLQHIANNNPDLVTIMLGINDYTINAGDPAPYYTAMVDLVDAIQTASPLSSILLIAPYATLNRSAATWGDYQNTLRDIAIEKGCAFLDFTEIYGDVGSSYDDYSMSSDNVHLDQDEHYSLAEALYDVTVGGSHDDVPSFLIDGSREITGNVVMNSLEYGKQTFGQLFGIQLHLMFKDSDDTSPFLGLSENLNILGITPSDGVGLIAGVGGTTIADTVLYRIAAGTWSCGSSALGNGYIIDVADPVVSDGVATKNYVDLHINDTVDAHDAVAISYGGSATPGLTATNVEDAIDQTHGLALDHINDTVDAHDASAISYAGSASPTYSGTDVEAIIDEIIAEKVDITLLTTLLALKAPLASPTFTGTVTLPTGLTGALRADSGVVSVNTNTRRTVTFIVDGAGSVISTGTKKEYVTVPFNGVIKKWRVLALDGNTGAIQFDVFKDAYASFPSTTSITASDQPKITATANKQEGTALTGWTTSVTAGDILEIEVDSVTTFTKVKLELEIEPT